MREITYPLSAFTKAVSPAAGAAGRADADAPAHSKSAVRIASVDELDRWDVPARVRVIIVQGHHPEETKEDNSRSAWLYDVLCHLYRKSVPDDVIYNIITDSGFGISASVLDKGSNIEKYALRQMARAKGVVESEGGDPIAWVNQKYFAALEGGKVRYYREDENSPLAMMATEAFNFELAPHEHAVKTENGEVKLIPFSKLWRRSNRRRYYRRGFVLDPSHGEHPEEYNLWHGFGIEPRAGDWSRMRQHILTVLASGNAAHADYIIKWAAWAVQHPAIPPRVALVFRGGEGVGKGAFADALRRIFGRHGLRIQNMMHFTGRFNAHLRHICMLFADEAVAPDFDSVGSLKGLISETTFPIEAKGVDVVDADNHIHVVMASNEEWVVPMGEDARRFAMFDVSSHRQRDTEYFRALFEEIEDGGLSAMLHDLLQMDLKGWHPEPERPETAALAIQKIKSLRGIQREWYNLLLTGQLPIHDGSLGKDFVRVATTDLQEYIQFRLKGERITANDIGALLGDGKGGMGFQRVENRRPRGFILPSLSEARKRWDEKHFVVDWPREAQGELLEDNKPANEHGWHNVDVTPSF